MSAQPRGHPELVCPGCEGPEGDGSFGSWGKKSFVEGVPEQECLQWHHLQWHRLQWHRSPLELEH